MLVDIGEGEMTSGVNTESESDSVPDTGTDWSVGFWPRQTDVSAPGAMRYGALAPGRGKWKGRCGQYGTFTGGLAAECTESLRVTSWWDGGGTERVVDMAGGGGNVSKAVGGSVDDVRMRTEGGQRSRTAQQGSSPH